MHGEPVEVIVPRFALTGMDARSHLESEGSDFLADGSRAPHCPSRSVKGSQKAVAEVLDRPGAKLSELVLHDLIVASEKLVPPLVADFCCVRRGADDVGEQHRPEHPVGLRFMALSCQEELNLSRDGLPVACEEHVIRSQKLHVASVGQPLGQIAAQLDWYELFAAVKHERRHAD